MDQLEAAKVLFERIRVLESEDFSSKIVGHILQNYAKQEMIRLALGPNESIHKLIEKAKAEPRLPWTPTLSPPISPSLSPPFISDHYLQFAPFSPASPLPYASPVSFGMCNPFGKRQALVGGQQGMSLSYPSFGPDELRLHNHFTNVEDHLEQVSINCSDFSRDFCPNGDTEGPRNGVKTCHYFNKGYCKHGINCRYFHGQQFSESSLHGGLGSYSSENAVEDQVLSPRSLDKLELEIMDLLNSRRGNPVSIASLPMMYYEKYGRTLQAEGYLTESQRHGKAGYSLTRLLARLKNIVLIDRPHGQHSVILAEDAAKFMELRGEKNDPGPIVNGSRQIYLTFLAESIFTVDDVRDYFNTFGQVEDVRIPCQQKRMFGFVTFFNAATVKKILSKGNPHFVCGARVLVKPYREKSKLVERKYQAQFEPPMCFHLDDLNMDPECHGGWPFRLQKEQLMQEHEHALELEARHLSQLCLANKPLPTQSSLGRSLEDRNITEESALYPRDDKLKNLHTEYTDPESNDGLNLPDSLFESPMASNIPSAM